MKNKNMSRLLYALPLLFLMALPSFASVPDCDEPEKQRQEKRQDRSWYDRMMAEKIAFFTSEMDLTPAEAEKFWPVYNQIDNEQHKLFNNIGNAYDALEKALDSKASDKEIENRLKAYTEALKEADRHETSQLSRYDGIISKRKVAKMVIAEEKFRRQQISRLRKPKN